jgi:hypothetical protein
MNGLSKSHGDQSKCQAACVCVCVNVESSTGLYLRKAIAKFTFS